MPRPQGVTSQGRAARAGHEPAIGMPVDESLGVEARQGFSHRGPRHLQAGSETLLSQPLPERELPVEQLPLQAPVGMLQPP